MYDIAITETGPSLFKNKTILLSVVKKSLTRKLKRQVCLKQRKYNNLNLVEYTVLGSVFSFSSSRIGHYFRTKCDNCISKLE